ncbi:hypothetical protein HK101_008546 [Irineochytrium annulatum]|nr:hypothetical protein HK101_008546 [Irineochytrium annulatum]
MFSSWTPLKEFASLRSLNLSSNGLTGSVEDLIAGLTELQSIDLSENCLLSTTMPNGVNPTSVILTPSASNCPARPNGNRLFVPSSKEAAQDPAGGMNPPSGSMSPTGGDSRLSTPVILLLAIALPVILLVIIFFVARWCAIRAAARRHGRGPTLRPDCFDEPDVGVQGGALMSEKQRLSGGAYWDPTAAAAMTAKRTSSPKLPSLHLAGVSSGFPRFLGGGASEAGVNSDLGANRPTSGERIAFREELPLMGFPPPPPVPEPVNDLDDGYLRRNETQSSVTPSMSVSVVGERNQRIMMEQMMRDGGVGGGIRKTPEEVDRRKRSMVEAEMMARDPRPLPSGWSKAWDPRYGRFYFVGPDRKTSWADPRK